MDDDWRNELSALDYAGRTVLEPRSGGKQAWGLLAWGGQARDEWSRLPDGRDVEEVLRARDLDSLPPCWVRITDTGAYGDMIWDGAMVFCFVSDRFVEALRAAGIVDGYLVRPLEVRPKRGPRFAGYSLLVADDEDPDAPIRFFPFRRGVASALDVSAEVMAALSAAGVTGFLRTDAATAAARLLEPLPVGADRECWPDGHTRSRDEYAGRTTISALWGEGWASGLPAWEGQDPDAWHILPDGRYLQDVLESGDLASLPPCSIRLSSEGACADMLGDQGSIWCVVSDRLLAALHSAGIGGFQTIPVEVSPVRGDPFGGYSVLVPAGVSPAAAIRGFPSVGCTGSTLDLSADAWGALVAAGVTGVDAEPAVEHAQRIGMFD